MLPPPLDSRERKSDVTSMNQSIPTCAAFVLVLMMKTLIQDVNGCNARGRWIHEDCIDEVVIDNSSGKVCPLCYND